MGTYVDRRCEELGLKKVDSKEPLLVEVTSRDITLAKQRNSKCCAFARASKREVVGVRRAYFFRSVAWLEFDDKMVRYELPHSVQKEIVSFDRSKIMTPGTYQLSATPPSNHFGPHKKRDEKRKASGTRASGSKVNKTGRKVIHRTELVRNLQEPEE